MVSYTPFIRIGSERPPWTQFPPPLTSDDLWPWGPGRCPLAVFFRMLRWLNGLEKKHRGEKIPFFWLNPNLKNIQNQDFQRGANSTLRDSELTPFRNHLAPLWRCWYNWIYLEHILYQFCGNCGWLWGSSWWRLTATCFTGIDNYVSLHVWCVWPTFT